MLRTILLTAAVVALCHGLLALEPASFPAKATHRAPATSQPFEIKCRKADDQIAVAVEREKAVFTVTSPSGVSGATIERTGDRWPEAVVLRLHLSGLETFEIECGKAGISIHGHGKPQRPLEDGKGGTPPPRDNPRRVEVGIIDAPGKPARNLSGEDGYFEVRFWGTMLNDKEKTLKLSWIDFYR